MTSEIQDEFGHPVEQGSATPPAVPSQGPGRSTLTVVAAALVLVLSAAAGGATLGHEYWAGSASTTVRASSTQGSSGFVGRAPFSGFGNPSIGSGSFGAGGFSNGSGFSNGNGFSNGRGSFGSGGSSGGSVASGSEAPGSPANVDSIAAKVSGALVDIDSTLGLQSAAGAGTGIVLSSNGLVLTNNHVIEGSTKLTATDVGNGKTYQATVVGYDPTHDVAVIQLQGASGLQTAELGDSAKVSVGQAVVGVGNAGGEGGAPASAGGSVTSLNSSITALDELGASERLTGLIGVEAGIQSGDSGGPLVDTGGRVIGMNTAGSRGAGFISGRSTAYAIPINSAISIAAQLEAGHPSATAHVGATAFLGIQVAAGGNQESGGFGNVGGFTGGSSASGATVANVINGEPAQQAGLGVGDVITSLDGKNVTSRAQLGSLMLGHHPGEKVAVGWKDPSGQPHTSSVTLASGPPA